MTTPARSTRSGPGTRRVYVPRMTYHLELMPSERMDGKDWAPRRQAETHLVLVAEEAWAEGREHALEECRSAASEHGWPELRLDHDKAALLSRIVLGLGLLSN